MTSNLYYNGKEALLCLGGRIGPETESQLREAFNTVTPETVSKLILDFSDVEYISSVGLRELMILKKRLAGKPVVIRNARRTVEAALLTAGFYSFFDKETAEEACSTDGKLPLHVSFRDFLAEKVASGSDKTIIRANGGDYSWKDIDRGAQIIAEELRAQGVGKGTHVALCGANSINWVFCFYAIQKLGGIALLFNSNLTAPEVVALSKTSDATHFCYGEMPLMKEEKAFLSVVLEESPVTSVCDIRNNRRIETEKRKPPKAAAEETIEADDPCVMIFTSGSTGTPKGVLLSAYSILNASASNVESLHITNDDKACLILPMFHIFGLVAGLGANAIADSLMIMPSSIRTANLIRTVYEERCTILHSVPTMFLSIVNNAEFDPEKMSSLRSTILSGAAATEAQVRMLQEKFPNNHFSSSYGLSEMAPVSITDYEDTVEHITKSIGKLIPDIEARIVDPEKKTVCEAGDTGEILLRGYNLMTCYYKAAPDLQAIDEEGWLHTGDLGSLDADGYLYFAGRIKELIKRGGESIIPNEVASAVSENDMIADVRVFGIPDEFWGETVAAAVITKDNEPLDENRLRRHLRTRLAKFKIPEYFICFEAFPTLPNGKIDAVNLKKEIEERVKILRESKGQ